MNNYRASGAGGFEFYTECEVVKEIQVEMDERIEGESYLNLTNSIKYMSRMIISILFIQYFRK